MVFDIQRWILAILSVVLFGIEVWALINALRFPADAYLAAGKRTRLFWGLLTALAVLLGFISLPFPLGGGFGGMLLTIIGIVIAGVFLADVLPAVRQVMSRAQGRYRRPRRR